MEIQEGDRKIFYDLSQKIAEAIESVLKIDVTIMNDQRIRIAGTGKYNVAIGEKIEQKTAFDFCMQTLKECIVEEAKKSEICKNCSRINKCNEKAQICVPIMCQGKSIGVIGIIAFNEKQKEEFSINKSKYVNFIHKMASMLEAKYSELIISRENTILSSRLNIILNTIVDAIIVFKNDGTVIYQNSAYINLLNHLCIGEYDCFASKVWDYIIQNNNVLSNSENNEVSIEYKNKNYLLLADVSLLKENKQFTEVIVSLKDYKKVQMKMIQHSEKNQLKVDFDNILSVCRNFNEIKEIALKAANTDSNVLIYGESGTGKELFARAIHNNSSRKDNAFIPINCGAIPDELLESELFGHEKGAFTGATNTKIGKFEVADNGTIFLDEISEMPFRLQVKLLRVLQERELCRIGSNQIKKINVRIIAATNADLMLRIREKLFREDLYYRLNIIPIHIPPLRERKEDITYIANHFILTYNKLFNKKIKGLSEEAIALFESYAWPGNVRELQNVIEFAVNFEICDEISDELISKRLNILTNNIKKEITYKSENKDFSLNQNINLVGKEIFESKLKEYEHMKHKDIVKKICKDLEISRSTFYRKLKKYNICSNLDTISK